MRFVWARYTTIWLAIFAAVLLVFWFGYWLGGIGGEMAEFRDRFSWTGFAVGLICAFPIGLIMNLIKSDRHLVAPWRQFDELRNQLDELERLWKASGDEYQRMSQKLVDLESGTARRQDGE